MKLHLWAAALLAGLTLASTSASAQSIAAPPPSAQDATPEQLLEALILHSRRSARIENGRLAGEGADFIRELGHNSQFVLIGEQHGVAGIAQFTTAYWRDLNALGYNYAVSESDPWVTQALERELRGGGVPAWTRFMQDHGGAVAAPFYSWLEETEWIDEVVRNSRAREAPRIWGVDQVFIGAAAWQMRDLAENARSAEARGLAAQMLEGSEDVTWFSGLTVAQLENLRAALNGRRDGRYAELVDAMIVSHRIYQPFTGGGGEAYLANTERENLMRSLFLENYRRAETMDGAAPRVMFKMGASHIYRGASSLTQTQGFGGFVSEFAAGRGAQATTILAICSPGGRQASAFAPPADCTTDPYRRNWSFIDQYADPSALTVFDLRAWRLRPRRWNTLPFDVQQAILSFDVLVIVPAGPGATLLPGLTQPAPPRPRN